MQHRAIVVCFFVGAGLVAAAWAGEIDGRINGWRPVGMGSLRNGVVWLGGGPSGTLKSASQPEMAQFKGRFVPPFMVVVAGQSVAMPNEDEVAHNVYSNSPAKTFNLGFYAKGDRRVVNFEMTGVVDVACSIHQNMRATIVVVPNSYYSIVKEDGTFRLNNVPAGDYTLRLWGEGLGQMSEDVAVPALGKIEVTLVAEAGRFASSR